MDQGTIVPDSVRDREEKKIDNFLKERDRNRVILPKVTKLKLDGYPQVMIVKDSNDECSKHQVLLVEIEGKRTYIKKSELLKAI